MEIGQPIYFFALLLIPAVIWIYISYTVWQKKALQKLGEQNLIESLVPGRSRFRSIMKLLLPLTAFMLIIIALTDLKSGSRRQMIPHAGMDLAIVLDVSSSMQARDDGTIRLDAAKEFATALIGRLPGTRIAIMAFAGRPVLQTPLTIDHAAALLSLSAISADHIADQGSDLGEALQQAVQALPENQNHYRAIVLISDGEDHEGRVEAAIRTIRNERIVVCTAGIGSEKGATIPVTIDGAVTEKKDRQGRTVVTRYQPQWLIRIAEQCRGMYVKADDTDKNSLQKIVDHLDAISKNRFDEELIIPLESRFQWLLLPALLLLLLDFLISKKKSKWLGI